MCNLCHDEDYDYDYDTPSAGDLAEEAYYARRDASARAAEENAKKDQEAILAAIERGERVV